MNNLDKIGFNNKDVCLMGDSAGANLVAATVIKMRKTLDFKIEKQMKTQFGEGAMFLSEIGLVSKVNNTDGG